MSDDTTPHEIPAGFGERADGVLIPQADEVQGPHDIQTQYGQDSIPEQFPDVIERNRVAGLDAKGHPIPGAPLSAAAEKSVAYEASLAAAAVPVITITPATASTPETPAAQVTVVTHADAAPEHVSWLHAKFEEVLAEFHRLLGGHV